MNVNEYQKLLGQIIRNERERQNLTQEELSARINLIQGNLSNIENGKNFPAFATFCALVETLNIEPNEVLCFLKFSTNDKDPIDIEIQEQVKKLPNELKNSLLTILNNMNS